ncbi:hypothetical protein D3C80_2001180 [compost metagenome]
MLDFRCPNAVKTSRQTQSQKDVLRAESVVGRLLRQGQQNGSEQEFCPGSPVSQEALNTIRTMRQKQSNKRQAPAEPGEYERPPPESTEPD